MKNNEEHQTFIKQSANVLTIGIDYRKPMGGVAQVIYVYQCLFSPFHFIRTVVPSNSKALKAYIFVEAFIKYIFSLVFNKEIKIVHVHGASRASAWRKSLFIRVAKAFDKKVVYHMHGGGFKIFAAEHKEKVGNILNKCDCIVALSDTWKEYFETEFGCKKVVVIKNVIEPPQIHRKEGELFSLLFLGWLRKEKGIYDLLQVISENKDEYNGSIKLYLGGDGEVDECKKFTRNNGIDDIVEYMGWVSGKDKIDLFNKADAYILPSYIEGLPISILEAMSYSLPVISTNVGGIPEVLKDGVNGFIMEAGDKFAMKTAIDKLMKDKALRKEMGYKSKEMVKYHLPEYVKDQLEELYDTLL